MYQTGSTIKNVMDRIYRHDYVLPAIQREFVWKSEQIERLFDSLMQGYPFGTFLLWQVQAENSGKYRFYDFVRDYHQRDNPHCPSLPIQHDRVTAVLDGQQRLTALNIGLRGSMTTKLPNKWWNNPDAWPMRRLYIDLLAELEPSEEGDRYRFKFLRDDQFRQADPDSTCWYEVADILAMGEHSQRLNWVNEHAPAKHTDAAINVLQRLYDVIHTKPLIAYYEEESQDLSTVLSIFIRMNSGGTVLSYSDLLLSIAVAQWSRLDAREEIHRLVDDINHIGNGFDFAKDLVLKAGLVLTDISEIAFRVENFDSDNMLLLENRWPDVAQAIELSVRLLASFGYSAQNLRAGSVVLPIAYYLDKIRPGSRYLNSTAFAQDRQRISNWVARSLLKSPGIWSGGLDTLLTGLREVIRNHEGEGFPLKEIEARMSQRGKSLVFEDEEIEELLDLEYGNGNTFSLLTLLYPFIDLQNQFHVDHVYPKAKFRKQLLLKEGLTEEQIELMQEQRDRIANLQLLDGTVNIEKQDMMPGSWLAQRFQDPAIRSAYVDRHLLGDVSDSMADFSDFYEMRRERLRMLLRSMLGVEGGASVASP